MNVFAMLFDCLADTPENLIIVIFPFLFCHLSLRFAIISIYELGKSKSFLKKEKCQLSFLSKLFLYGFVARCKQKKKLAYVFYYFNLMYSLIAFICIVLWMLSLLWLNLKPIAIICTITKAFIFEVPYVVYFFINTKNDRRRGRGGVIWRWEDK